MEAVIENKMMQGMRAVLKMTTVTTGACCCKDSANQDRGSTARETLTEFLVYSEDLSPQLGEDHLDGPVICESVPDPKP